MDDDRDSVLIGCNVRAFAIIVSFLNMVRKLVFDLSSFLYHF